MKHVMVALVVAVFWTTTAHADLELSPLRHVITKASPKATFSISNPSSRIMEGRVTWIDLSATETGYEPASPELRATLSAAPYLTVEPAHFRLEPGARVTVSVHLKKGVRIPRGERRSHLLFETAAARTSIRKASQNGLQIDIGVGVSAPVLLRNGGKVSASVGETKLLRDDEGLLVLATKIESKGAISPFGRLTVSYTPRGDNDEIKERITLATRENAAGYLDAPAREFELPLDVIELGAGELEIRYEGRSEFEGRLFDKRVFELAPAK